ncbi:DUF1353 domain-containing protein [Escherichia coli]|uniref:DUF1353 domain-containing protein n=1 Tax=Escherichia coli TaxID=562 RepID=A0ACD5GGI4_ECOLX|nr:DUF1353 domain-containing protein [Escherichia coli]EHP6140085.1 DUF1353 domain-containing protein [Escherichia coli]EHZ5979856.1 DUF1353 domain-containing protein [Escherichia coli]EIT7660176.1 DUF1353 domain-containing protein [Escherichia coli]EIZ3278683.1 DUF1353 domain-containing protein [Escherichia coli]EIZ3378419.1 DUF1353 domain-containing protein [Escherichia coli]
MSKFTTPAVLEMLDDYRWRLVESFEFWLTESPDDVIRVPAGYVTDLASVPRLLWSVFPPHGRYAKAAIIHDWLYDNALRTKKEADRIFLDAMNVLEVPAWRRLMMYCAVHLFWRGNYKLAHQKTM